MVNRNAKKVITTLIIFLMLFTSLFSSVIGTNEVYAQGGNNQAKGNTGPVIGTDHPTEPGEVMLFKQAVPVEGMVNVWDITLRIEGRDKPVTSDIILVIDTSGSMNDNGRMQAAKDAANLFIDTLLPAGNTTTRIGIVNFDYYAYNAHALSMDATSLKNAVNGLSAGGGTFTQEAVKQAEEMLAGSNANYKHIVLLSDGMPTYSYEINYNYRMNTSNLERFYVNQWSQAWQTRSDTPEGEFGTLRFGTGNSIRSRYDDPWGTTNDKYYNHGNSAIAQAGFAKARDNRVWTIALDLDPNNPDNQIGIEVLQAMASPDSFYESDPSSLSAVFANIAGLIGAAVQDAVISDPMGVGFQVPIGEVINISATQGIPSYDPVTKKITWNPGTLTEPIEEGSDIRYAELTYRVELNDAILGQEPDANGEYPVNGNANISYKDSEGNTQTGSFPVPTVNPVLYKVVKVLQDKDGNTITADRDFTIEITGPWGDGTVGTKTFTLNTSTLSSTALLTDLRWGATYTFEETGTSLGLLADYEIKYYVNGVEQSSFTIVDGNTADVEIKIVNKEKSIYIDVSGSKTWDDANDQDGARPDSITIRLWADGTEVDSKTVTPDNDGNWAWSFTGLNRYRDGGVEIVYTVTEDAVDGYDTEVSGYDVTNSYTPETVNIKIEKKWIDVNNQDGLRPESITINLLADGTKVDSATVTADDGWAWSFTGLNRYRDGGVEIVYTVTEDEVDGYDKPEYSSGENNTLFVTNCHEPAVIEIFGTKTWEDEDNVYDTRPDSITIRLWADGKEIASKEVTGKDGWSWSFTGFPKFKDGKEIKYTVTEDAVAGYTSDITGDQASGYVVTNTYTPVPPTGDNFKPMIWITVMIISLILIVILNVYKNEYIKKLYMKI